jgi:hypothetical protein
MRIPMQLVRLEARQDPEYPHQQWYEGAAIDCFIKDQTESNALYIAKGAVEDDGWVVTAVEEQYEINEESFDTDTEKSKFFQQALTDEEVFVFYCWEEGEDDESEHQEKEKERERKEEQRDDF